MVSLLNMDKKKKALGFLFIVLVGIALYCNTLNSPFIYDDLHTIVENPYIKQSKYLPSLFDLSSIKDSAARSSYRPVLMLTFFLNYTFGGLNPFGYHLINITLHILNAILVFCLINRLFAPLDSKHLTGFTSNLGYKVSLFSSLLFLVHPVNSETVNYITCRSELLAGFFVLLSFLLFIKSRASENPSLYRSSLIVFTLGLFSKEAALILPLILITYDICFFKDKKGFSLRFKRYYLAYFIIIFGYVLLRAYLLGNFFGSLYKVGVSRSFAVNLLTQAKVIVFLYLRLIFLPLGLSIDHYIPVSKNIFEWQVLFSLVTIIVLLAVAFKVIKRQAIISFFLFWFFINLLPTSLIPLHIIANEHRLYLASISFSFLLSWGLIKVFSLKKFQNRHFNL